MKQLTVLRHAKSSWGDPQLDDFDRPLNMRGRDAAEAVGRELKRRGAEFDCVVASPAARVRQTLDLFAAGYGALPDIRFEPELYGASEASLLELVRALPDSCSSVLLVGHNPGLQQLILTLADPKSRLRAHITEKYPTAAATTVRFAADEWRTAKDGEILGSILPREIDAG